MVLWAMRSGHYAVVAGLAFARMAR